MISLSPSNFPSREILVAIEDRAKAREIQLKAHSVILLSLGDEVLREAAEKDSEVKIWEKLESLLFEEITRQLIVFEGIFVSLLTSENT